MKPLTKKDILFCQDDTRIVKAMNGVKAKHHIETVKVSVLCGALNGLKKELTCKKCLRKNKNTIVNVYCYICIWKLTIVEKYFGAIEK